MLLNVTKGNWSGLRCQYLPSKCICNETKEGPKFTSPTAQISVGLTTAMPLTMDPGGRTSAQFPGKFPTPGGPGMKGGLLCELIRLNTIAVEATSSSTAASAPTLRQAPRR